VNEAQKRALEPELAMKVYSHLHETRPRAYSLGELSAELKVDVAQVHYQLSRLVDVGLVEPVWRGTTVTYRLMSDEREQG
jgi:DNA-binding transcriptional ArsR family regulator